MGAQGDNYSSIECLIKARTPSMQPYLLHVFLWLSVAANGAAAAVAFASPVAVAAPGAATTAACAKMKTLKAKFVSQLASTEEQFRRISEEYSTKICTGPGCEPDEAKRIAYQKEFEHIEALHVQELDRLQKLLSTIEGYIAEVPFRRCPEFEGYLSIKAQLERGKSLTD